MKRTVHMPPGEGERVGDTRAVLAWAATLGELVREGAPLLRVCGRDGVEEEIPCPTTGVLFRWTIMPGDAVEPGEPIAVLAGVPEPLELPDIPPPRYVPDGVEEPVERGAAERARAEHHGESWRSAPHQLTLAGADLSEVERLRLHAAPGFTERTGLTLGHLPFVVAAVAAALRRYPHCNARKLSPTDVRLQQAIRLGLPGPNGVPVLRDADRLSVLSLAREIGRLRSLPQLPESDRRGATATLTDLTETGVLWQAPILHQPQVIHLCAGSARAGRLHLCLASDAGVVDSAEAAGFVDAVRRSLEEADFLFV